jgi:hypothetical protein
MTARFLKDVKLTLVGYDERFIVDFVLFCNTRDIVYRLLVTAQSVGD